MIELMLTSSDPEQVKVGLQRACEIFERGQAFVDPTFLRVGLAAHLTSRELRVRRWAYKLAALLGDAEQLGQLEIALLGEEKDPENRGWASAAFSGLADESRKARVTSQLEDYRGTSLELAAKLYARGEPARDDLDLKVWQREPLARKWLCLLCGYARERARTIDRRFDDLDLVRNSVDDAEKENVEYSIWAEHRHPEGSYKRLLRRPDQLLAYPNVRRWVYRLLTKDPESAARHLDLLTEKMNAANESSDVAREGLALGLAGLPLQERRIEIIDWFSNEASPRVKLALVDHLALLADRLQDGVARDVLTGEFSRRGPEDIIGAKILSVSRPDWELGQYQLAAQSKVARVAQPELFVTIVQNQEYIMGNKIEQAGSNNSMVGVAGRDVLQSTIKAVQHQADHSFDELTPLIEAFLRALAASNLEEREMAAAMRAAEEVAKATGEEKKGKFQTLKGVVRGMLSLPGMAAEAIEGGEKLVQAIQQAVG